MAPSEQIGMLNATQLSLLKGTPAVTIIVGTHGSTETWTVQKQLLTAHSTFFKASLVNNFREAASNTVNLPEDEPEIFEIFVQYLYLGAATFLNSSPIQVAKAWILADKLRCSGFGAQALRRLILMHRNDHLKCSPELVRFIFKNSSTGSDIQRFVTCQFVIECWAGEHAESVDQWVVVLKALEDFSFQIALVTLASDLDDLYSLYEEYCAKEQRYLKPWTEILSEDSVSAIK